MLVPFFLPPDPTPSQALSGSLRGWGEDSACGSQLKSRLTLRTGCYPPKRSPSPRWGRDLIHTLPAPCPPLSSLQGKEGPGGDQCWPGMSTYQAPCYGLQYLTSFNSHLDMLLGQACKPRFRQWRDSPSVTGTCKTRTGNQVGLTPEAELSS